MMVTVRGTHRSFVPSILGVFLFAVGAADGHDLVVSARDADWPLLTRSELELLGAFWLLSGRFAHAARIVALVTAGCVLASDLTHSLGGYPTRPIFGRIAVNWRWIILIDFIVVAALVCCRTISRQTVRPGSHPAWLAMTLLSAGAAGVTIDRSQIGQFPIVATGRAGTSSAGLDYLVYLPDGYYKSWRKWPMILTLHGRGEAGEDLGPVRRQGLPQRVEGKGHLPFVIVAPLSPDWNWNIGALDILLDEALKRYRVDADRVYLVGNSMGGVGTWALAAHCPQRFAAIAPICGRGDPASVKRLTRIPTWAFHGADDRIVPVEQSERMITALRQAGGDARLTVYPLVGHDAWTPTYANPQFYEWLLRHRRAR
jgi:pimeloyl-ACP methyl ester carboxylesterase